MKRAVLIAIAVVILFAGDSFAQMYPGMMGGGMGADFSDDDVGYGYQMGPGMMRGYGMGPGMMGGGGMGPGMRGGYGMGRGMMGGYGMGHGMMGGYGMGPGMMRGYGMGHRGAYGRGYGGRSGTSPEVYQKFMDETASLRKKIHDKKFIYFEAARNPKTTRENLFKMEKELYELRQQLQENAWEAFRE